MSQVAVITGASQGIGKAMAEYFAKKGYQLALISRNLEKLNVLAEKLRHEFHVDVGVYPIDVSDKRAVAESVNSIMTYFGRIDVLFNNAGVSYRGTTEMDLEKFEEMIRINLLGAVYIINAIVPHMKQKKNGYIFNLVSRSGVIARPIVGGYAASKFGLRGYSEALYKELAPLGIKVTALHPGWVNSDMTNLINIPPEEKIQFSDIAAIVEMLLHLSPYTFIGDILIEPQGAIGMNS